jgi:anti-anti-sigma factor
MKVLFEEKDNFIIITFGSGRILFELIQQLIEKFEINCKNLKPETNVILNFKNIDFIDSSGLGFLINLKKSFLEKNCNCVISNIQENVANILRYTQVISHFQIFETLEEAIDMLKKNKLK